VRWLPLTGIAFVALFVAAALLYGSGAGSSAGEIAAYYADAGDRLRQIGGFAALLLGCVFLGVYVAVLVRRVVSAEPLAPVALVSGACAVGLLAVANALWAATAFTVELEPGYRPSPHTHLLVEDGAFVVLVSAAALALPFVAVTSWAATAARVLPRWFAVLGVLAMLGLAAAYWYVPLLAFLVWIAAGSLALTGRWSAGCGYPHPRPPGQTLP
jgi:hypothetical protein